MRQLEMVRERDGAVIDRVTWDGDGLSYETELAEDILEPYTDINALWEEFAGWSNGYVSLVPAAEPTISSVHLFTCREGNSKTGKVLHKGPCAGWRSLLPETDPRHPKNAPPKKPRVSKPRTRKAPYLTQQQAQQMQDRMLEGDPWTDGQKHALYEYAGNMFKPMNDVLRGAAKPEDREAYYGLPPGGLQQLIDDATAGMRPTTEPLTVTRALGWDAFGLGDVRLRDVADAAEGLRGHTFEDPGFLSTTTKREPPLSTIGNATLKLEVPAGTPAAYIRSLSSRPEESEIILGPGTAFEVTDVQRTPRGMVVSGRVMPRAPGPEVAAYVPECSGLPGIHLFTCMKIDAWNPRIKPGPCKKGPGGAAKRAAKAAVQTKSKTPPKKAATPRKPGGIAPKAKPAGNGTAADIMAGDFSSLKRVGPQLGSNEGGTYQAPDGSQWYVKKQRSPEHAANEALANDLYRMAGIEVPDVATSDGGPGGEKGAFTASRIIDTDGQRISPIDRGPEYIDKVRDGFAVDAWLANWDVAGMGMDNLATSSDGNPVRIDAGGSLLYRAQGAPKGAYFGSVANEWDTLRSPSLAPDAAQFYQGITEEQMIASARHLDALTPAVIDRAVEARGLPPEVTDALIARRADIQARAKTLGERGNPNYPFVTPERAQAAQDDMLADNPWTPEQADALKTYTGLNGYQDINGVLRGDDLLEGGRTLAEVEQLASDMNASMRPLPQNVRVTRISQVAPFGIDPNQSQEKKVKQARALVGSIFQDPGFLSTTVDDDDYQTGYNQVKLILDVPAGTPAAYVDGITRFDGEHELVLGAGRKMRIVSVKPSGFGTGLEIHAEIVPEGE